MSCTPFLKTIASLLVRGLLRVVRSVSDLTRIIKMDVLFLLEVDVILYIVYV